jgi:hypothetical protein
MATSGGFDRINLQVALPFKPTHGQLNTNRHKNNVQKNNVQKNNARKDDTGKSLRRTAP